MIRSLASLPLSLVLAALAGAARADDIVGAPVDLSASVHEALLPGGTIFDDAHTLAGIAPTPVQKAEYLYFPAKGQNLSGRSPAITGAFASATAASDGNGGVGVTSFIGPNPSSTNSFAMEQLVARATWSQSFSYLGAAPATVVMNLHIPKIEVGLIGVPPERTFPSGAETAEAVVDLTATITHADGTTSPGGQFLLGLRASEEQFFLGPNTFRNVAVFEAIGGSIALFSSFADNGSASNPRYSLDNISTSVKLGTLSFGDTVSYVYNLTAQGTTNGGEQGFMAFVGDPFQIDAFAGNLSVSVSAAVPEPSTWAMMLIGLAGLAGVSRRRAAACRARG